MRAAMRLAGVMLFLGACSSNPPAEPLYPRSARSVFYCAVSMIETDGYILDSEHHRPGDPGFRSAIFRRGEVASLYLAVSATTRGQLRLLIRTRPVRDTSTEESWRHRIIANCTQ
jgi:hypothetical protein